MKQVGGDSKSSKSKEKSAVVDEAASTHYAIANEKSAVVDEAASTHYAIAGGKSAVVDQTASTHYAIAGGKSAVVDQTASTHYAIAGGKSAVVDQTASTHYAIAGGKSPEDKAASSHQAIAPGEAQSSTGRLRERAHQAAQEARALLNGALKSQGHYDLALADAVEYARELAARSFANASADAQAHFAASLLSVCGSELIQRRCRSAEADAENAQCVKQLNDISRLSDKDA